jgi:SAM-dependent methyltransferase
MSAGDADRRGADNAYDEQYFKETYGCDGLKRCGMHWWSVRWYAMIVRRCMRAIGGRRMLEIGCGHGFMLGRLENEFDTYGVDISRYAIDQAAAFAPKSICAVADIEQQLSGHLPTGTFDMVVAKYVFEHLENPLTVMRRVATLLRPGGILFLSIPNTESIGARWKGQDWYAHQDPTHCSLLAPDRWLEIVAEAGLELSKESADGYWDLPYIRWLPVWLQFPVFIGPSAFSCLIGRAILPARFGENLLIFARKPVSPEAPR